jgi:folate-binding protein YgfZ
MQSDMRVLRTGDEEILIVTEPDRLGAVRRHLEMYSVGREVEIGDRSDDRVLLRVAGPASIRALGDTPLGPEHANRTQRIAETDCLIVATDAGADVLVPADRAEPVRDAILAAGADPVAPDALEIIRVEAGRPRFGAEMTEGTMPQEAGINDRAVDFSKGCYIGQETVARLHYRGKPNRHLRRLRPDREVRAGEEVSLGDRVLGTVGTAVLSPAEGPLALAILRREADPGSRVTVGDVEATVEETT